MIKFERVSVMNFENAMRGARNPLNSWERSDSRMENGDFIFGENDLGLYAYDMGTLGFIADKNGTVDTNLVGATVKTLFTEKKMLKSLQAKYADKLKGKEKVQYCLLDMQYNMAEKTYTVTEMRVFTNKNRIIETKKNKTGFVPVPEKSFAEAMYEICQQFVTEGAAPEEGGQKASLLSK